MVAVEQKVAKDTSFQEAIYESVVECLVTESIPNPEVDTAFFHYVIICPPSFPLIKKR